MNVPVIPEPYSCHDMHALGLYHSLVYVVNLLRREPCTFTDTHADTRRVAVSLPYCVKVRTLESPNPLKATYTVIHMFAVLLLASVPSFILNLPVGIVAR